MKRIIVALTALFWLLVPAAAFAYQPLKDACQNASQSVGCDGVNNTSHPNPLTGPDGVLHKITLVIAIIAGIAAVIVMIVAGFQFVVSGGDAQKVANARNAIIGTIVGLILVALAASILTFVIGRVTT